jgi:6-phosphogluconolactonase
VIGLYRFLVVLPALLLAAFPCDGCGTATRTAASAAPASPHLVAYASGYAPQLHVLAVDAGGGALSPSSSVAAFGASPSFLAINPAATNLYAIDEEDAGRVGAYAIDRASGALTFLNAVSSNRFVFVPCKDAGYLAQFVFDASTGKLTPNAIPRVAAAAGAGPRHLAFHPNGRFAYVINEDNSTMTAYVFDGSAGTLAPIETQSTVPAGFTGTNTGAEVWVHRSGVWLFGSNRGDDSIVVFAIDATTGKLTRKGFTKTGGAEPRSFTLDPTGTFLYAANQTSGTIVPFRFDSTNGALTPVASAVAAPKVSFIGVVPLD